MQPPGTGTPVAGGMMVPTQPQPMQQPGQMTPGNLNEIYGILAQTGAADPQQLVNQYVTQMRGLQQQNNPTEQFLRMYGNVNPFDYDPQSIQRFHEEFVRTGQPRFDLLEERKKLSSVEEKRLFKSYDKMLESGNMIGRLGNLATQLDQQVASGEYKQGLYGTLDAWFKNAVTGGQDELSAIRTEYFALRNKDAIQNLPPGVASDRDIALALEGWPPATANPAYLAAFLRGVQKMQVLVYSQAMHENTYLSLNKSPGLMAQDYRAKADRYALDAMQANGLQIDRGGKTEYSREELEAYADGRMRDILTGGTYGGGQVVPTDQPGGDVNLPGVGPKPPAGDYKALIEYYRKVREAKERQQQRQ